MSDYAPSISSLPSLTDGSTALSPSSPRSPGSDDLFVFGPVGGRVVVNPAGQAAAPDEGVELAPRPRAESWPGTGSNAYADAVPARNIPPRGPAQSVGAEFLRGAEMRWAAGRVF